MRREIKVCLSVLMVLVLTLGSVNVSSIFGNMEQVRAENTADGLTKIGWTDFGFSYDETWTAGPNNHERTKYYNGGAMNTKATALNNTEFVGDIVFSDNAAIRYAAWNQTVGLDIGVVNGNFVVDSGQLYVTKVTVDSSKASEYGLTSFVNEQMTLKIQMRDYDESAGKATMSLYINDVAVMKDASVSKMSNDWQPGIGLCICPDQSGTGTVTLKKVRNAVAIPTGLTELTWEDFGYTCGSDLTYYRSGDARGISGDLLNNSDRRDANVYDSLNNTLFSGDIIMPSNTSFRYGENANLNGGGVSVKANADGTLSVAVLNNGTAVKTYTEHAGSYGLESFVNEKFNIKIAMQDLTGTVPKITVWVNNEIVGDVFSSELSGLAFGTVLYAASRNIKPISSLTIPQAGLTEIGFDDWTTETLSDQGKTISSNDGRLNNGELRGAHATLQTLVGTSFREIIKYEDTLEGTKGLHALNWGGIKGNSWYGIRFYLNADNEQMTMHCLDSYDSDGDGTKDSAYFREKYDLSPVTAGIGTSFRGQEISLRIDTVSRGNHVLLYVYFNEVLYNHAPFVFYDFAGDMTASMHYTSYERKTADSDDEFLEKINACYITIGASVKELPVLYHDLEKGGYTISYPRYTICEKQENGTWSAASEEKTTATTISESGDYKIAFHDGVSDYVQIVACYRRVGDVNVATLVRALRLKGNPELADTDWKLYEKRLCDTDYDGSVDEDDIADIRSMLLGTYEADASVMTISGFFSPTPVLLTDETYRNIRTVGVNHIIETNVSYTDDALSRYHVYQELAYAQKYGIAVTVKDGRLCAYGTKANSDTSVTTSDVEACVANYKNYQSFAGLFIVDEPKSSDYPGKGTGWENNDEVNWYKNVATAVKDAGYQTWSNMFSGSKDTFYRSNSYKYYTLTDTMVKNFGMDFVSASTYPFWDEYYYTKTNGTKVYGSSGVENAEYYFKTLAVLKHVASANNIAMRHFVQAGEGFEFEISENYTEAQLKWNVNTGLVFGGKGVEYFPLVHPASMKNYTDGVCGSGLLDASGDITTTDETTRGFGQWAQNMNRQVAAIDEVLMNATQEGLMSTGGYAKSVVTDQIDDWTLYKTYALGIGNILDSKVEIKNSVRSSYENATVTTADNATYGALTGCFNITDGTYAGKHALYIMNYDDTAAHDITVSFGSSKTCTVIYQGMISEQQSGATYTQSVAAGDAVLVIY